ncbi:hypothetical protein [Mycetohabitans rhizoxinica]|uniref:DNA transfer protein p32 n=1 Tax=Mycetohabitans rhizoxinica TaxID=412963 RepID=A0ABZ2PX88_9BURK
MSSGGGGGGGQTTRTELPGYAQPYAQQILERGAALSHQTMPYYTGPRVAAFTRAQQHAMDGINQLAGLPSPALTAASDAITGTARHAGQPYTVSNPYIGQAVQARFNPYATMENPYLDAQVKKAQSDIVNQYTSAVAPQTMAQFRNAGAFGGSAMQQVQDQQNRQLADALGNAGTQLRGQAYANTQQVAQQQAALGTHAALANQANNLAYTQANNALNSQNRQHAQINALNAASLAPALNAANYYGYGQQLAAGNMAQRQAQSELDSQYQRWHEHAYSPYQQLGVLQSALAGALGSGAQGVTTSAQSRGSPVMGALGGAASGAAIGSIVPGIGTALGAGVGGGLGLLGSIL